jgi:hypothetical protein
LGHFRKEQTMASNQASNQRQGGSTHQGGQSGTHQGGTHQGGTHQAGTHQSGSHQGAQQGGGNQGGQSQRQPGTNLRQEAERNFGSLSNVAGQASDYWERGEHQMREFVRDREGTAILVAVATGLGIGLVIGAAIGRSHREEQTWRDRINMEGFGRRLMDRIEGMIPDALSEHFS